MFFSKSLKVIFSNIYFWIVLIAVALFWLMLYKIRNIHMNNQTGYPNDNILTVGDTHNIPFFDGFFLVNFNINLNNELCFSSIDGFFCPKCRSKLKVKSSFLGNYKYYCPLDNLKFKSNYSSSTCRNYIHNFFNRYLSVKKSPEELNKLFGSDNFDKELRKILAKLFPSIF